MNLWSKLLGKHDKACDPLKFDADFGTGEAYEKRLNAFFLRIESVSITLGCIDGCGALCKRPGVSASVISESRALIRNAEASLVDLHQNKPTALQAGLLVKYYSGDEGYLSARRYLVKWFNGCDVEGAHAVLEAHVRAAKSCSFDKECQAIVDKCGDNLLRWRSKGFRI